jgi:hypothetical protein
MEDLRRARTGFSAINELCSRVSELHLCARSTPQARIFFEIEKERPQLWSRLVNALSRLCHMRLECFLGALDYGFSPLRYYLWFVYLDLLDCFSEFTGSLHSAHTYSVFFRNDFGGFGVSKMNTRKVPVCTSGSRLFQPVVGWWAFCPSTSPSQHDRFIFPL